MRRLETIFETIYSPVLLSEFTTFLELDCMLDRDASIEYNIINLQVDNLPVD